MKLRSRLSYLTRTVSRFTALRRRAADAELPAESEGSLYTRLQGPLARAVSFAMSCRAAKQSSDAQTYLDELCPMDVGIARAHT